MKRTDMLIRLPTYPLATRTVRMIDVENLTKLYGRGSPDRHPALDHVTFHVPEGTVFGLLGPNGAGKTTAIRILTTVLRPTAGTARVCGRDVVAEPRTVQRSIGYMPESQCFYPDLSGAEHIQFWSEFYRTPRRERRAVSDRLMEEVGLADAGKKKVKAYSHGMRKRLMIAQALLNDPPVLILDEPTAGLDPHGVIFFRELIRRLHRENRTILLSSHMLGEVEQLCAHVGIISRGRIMVADSLEGMRRRVEARGPVRILVECAPADGRTAELVRNLPNVQNVSLAEWGLIIETDPEPDPRADITAALATAGCRVSGIRKASPTLEEIFVYLSEKEGLA